ncbi:hypothetical protein DYBT9275_01207 [Dyadobacter sp. CECT 9275]|uniref:Uncharacterized protein n=1 Tax=Dyadobacter helix TaxID=2822344 RepID=A0A916JD61_9BACT|nr:hypothetical protein DYBT9275_01207 [Dyadobacter sp. CECT 9275]
MKVLNLSDWFKKLAPVKKLVERKWNFIEFR